MKPFPAHLKSPGGEVTWKFIAAYRDAFEAVGEGFCAGELDGVTLVIATGWRGKQLQEFVDEQWNGEIQVREHPPAASVPVQPAPKAEAGDEC